MFLNPENPRPAWPALTTLVYLTPSPLIYSLFLRRAPYLFYIFRSHVTFGAVDVAAKFALFACSLRRKSWWAGGGAALCVKERTRAFGCLPLALW